MASTGWRPRLWAVLLTPLITAPAAEAVILYSSPNRNTSPAATIAEGPWNLTGSWGSFLATPIASHYIITANHVGGNATTQFLFRGQTYTIDASFGFSGQRIEGTDLLLFKTNEAMPAFAPLYGASGAGSEVGKQVVMIGRGTPRGAEVRVNGELKGWEWLPYDAVQSWGENQVSEIASGTSLGDLIGFDFNAGAMPNEATFSGGDSGGGTFIQVNGEWQLAGVNLSVDGPFSYTGAANDPGFNAAIFDARGLYGRNSDGNWQLINDIAPVPAAAYASKISSNRNAIYSIIPSFPIRQQNYVVEGTADVGTVDVANAVTVGTSTVPATLRSKYVRAGSLTISRNSQVLLKPDGSDASVSVLRDLNFGGSTANFGRLDLADNDLIVHSTTSARQTDFNDIIAKIKLGRNAASRWNGNGIASSAAANDPDGLMGLGAILNDNGHGQPIYNFFDGQPVDMNSILVKYTLMGDLNLDGGIDADDYFLIDRGYSSPGLPRSYYNGDIDYNGLINADDYSLINSAFAMQFTLGGGVGEIVFPRLVPEPSVALILIPLSAFLSRRWRRASA